VATLAEKALDFRREHEALGADEPHMEAAFPGSFAEPINFDTEQRRGVSQRHGLFHVFLTTHGQVVRL
jgi:hypothetical protein